jgi:hypothetical protein
LNKVLKMIFSWVGGIVAALGAVFVAFMLAPEEQFKGPFAPYEISCQGTQPTSKIFLSKPSKSSDLVLTIGDETDFLKEVDKLPEWGSSSSDTDYIYEGKTFSLIYDDAEYWVMQGNELIGGSCS